MRSDKHIARAGDAHHRFKVIRGDNFGVIKSREWLGIENGSYTVLNFQCTTRSGSEFCSSGLKGSIEDRCGAGLPRVQISVSRRECEAIRFPNDRTNNNLYV